MLLVVGQVTRPHGVNGEVVVRVRTDTPQERYTVGAVFATEPASAGPLTVVSVRSHQNRLLVSFDGVADRDAADRLRGVLLCVDSAAVPEPADPDEFNDHQLIGLQAQTVSGEPIGEVVAVDHAPASDLLVVALPDGHRALVPFVKAIVPEVDLAGRRVVLTPPEGLLEL
jgi:16S rRNA processing protein RimM